MYYFDSITAKAPRESCLKKYQEASAQFWAHPASIHRLGQEVLSHLQVAYRDLASFFGADDQDTILFCSSPEEAIGHVIQGVWNDLARPSGRNHFLTTALDEAAIILNLEKISALGASHDLVAATAMGQIDMQALKESIHPRTQMLALSWANGLTGVIQPVEEIAQLRRERGFLLLLDASNLSGLYDLNLSLLEPDFVCLSGASLGGPHGSAALWIRKGLRLSPLLPCGHDWMHSTAAHPAALMALAVAARETKAERDRDLWHLSQLKDRFESKLKEKAGPIKILFEESERLVHVSCIAFLGVHCELLAWHLNRKELYAQFGGGMRQQLHYLLKACHVDPKIEHTALSFSLNPSMSFELIDAAVEILASTAKQLRTYHSFELLEPTAAKDNR